VLSEQFFIEHHEGKSLYIMLGQKFPLSSPGTFSPPKVEGQGSRGGGKCIYIIYKLTSYGELNGAEYGPNADRKTYIRQTGSGLVLNAH